MALVACTSKPQSLAEVVKIEPYQDSTSLAQLAPTTKYFDSLLVLSTQHKNLEKIVQAIDPKLVDKDVFTSLQTLLPTPQLEAEANVGQSWRDEAWTAMDKGFLEKADSIFSHNHTHSLKA